MHRTQAPFPPVAEPWEVPAFYRRLKAAVLELEGAWERGELTSALADPSLVVVVGPDVLASYHRLAASPPRRTAFRRDSIHAILEPLKELLSEPRHIFAGRLLEPDPRGMTPEGEPEPSRPGDDTVGETGADRPSPQEPAAGDRPGEAAGEETGSGGDPQPVRRGPLRVCVETGEGPVVLRAHHLVAARFWGIGVELGDPEAERRFARRLVRRAVRRLAADLNGLWAVEQWLRRLPRVDEGTRIVPDPAGRRFEQLLMDILNEDGFVARRAPLREDFLEKTDLRLRLPELKRRRGARIQVTQTTWRERHREKVARIRHAEEFVILSPRSLAEALAGPEAVELLDRAQLNALWSCLPHVPANEDELAALLKQTLLGALEQPVSHPRGPAAAVPAPLRELVRVYTFREARRSTAVMRRRLQNEGKPRPRRSH